MTTTAQELRTHAAQQDRRVRELARDALSVMAFSVGASITLVCGLVALSSLVR
jgi:hypothetical protein